MDAAIDDPLVEEIVPAPDSAGCCAALAGLPHRLFLDSASTGSRFGRYSFLTADPGCRGPQSRRGDECRDLTAGTHRITHGDGLVALRQLVAACTRRARAGPAAVSGAALPDMSRTTGA